MKPKQRELHYYIYRDKVNSKELLPDELLSQHAQEKIIEAVSNLPHPCNTILEDYYFNERRSREIMKGLNITRNKFYNCLDKGKYLLREGLNASFYDNANKILKQGR